MIHSLIFMANMLLLGIPTASFCIPWCWLTGNVGPLYRCTRFMLYSSCWLAGVRFQTVGRDQIPRDRACIFVANHVSNLDPPVLISLIPGRTSAFMKRSLMNLPVLGTGFKQGDFIAVDRSGSAAAAQQSVDAAARVLAKGIHFTVFAEGTRSRDGRMLPFKKGPFYLAMATGAPVVPVSIHGTEGFLRKGSLRIYPGTAVITFHPAVDPASFASREELMASVRATIAASLPEWMRT